MLYLKSKCCSSLHQFPKICIFYCAYENLYDLKFTYKVYWFTYYTQRSNNKNKNNVWCYHSNVSNFLRPIYTTTFCTNTPWQQKTSTYSLQYKGNTYLKSSDRFEKHASSVSIDNYKNSFVGMKYMMRLLNDASKQR